jgi:hypothetical protein
MPVLFFIISYNNWKHKLTFHGFREVDFSISRIWITFMFFGGPRATAPFAPPRIRPWRIANGLQQVQGGTERTLLNNKNVTERQTFIIFPGHTAHEGFFDGPLCQRTVRSSLTAYTEAFTGIRFPSHSVKRFRITFSSGLCYFLNWIARFYRLYLVCYQNKWEIHYSHVWYGTLVAMWQRTTTLVFVL